MKITHDLNRLFKFSLVGASNTLLSLLTIYGLMSIKVNYLTANIIGYAVGLINSFIWNRLWVFQSKNGKIVNQLILFLSVFILCYIVQVGILYFFVQKLYINKYLAQLLSMVVYTLLNYILNKQITFKLQK